MKDDNGAMRLERDPLGEKPVPADALYGVQTARALENFRISRQRVHPLFITAYAEIKKAAAEANVRTSGLDPTIGDAIVRAADELIAGRHRDQFDLDAFQAGAGTSYNMNLNEVIANRALEILGGSRGDYERVNPNDTVNKSQSTNDTMPTAMRVTAVRLLRQLIEATDALAGTLDAKAEEFNNIVKAGRTHLHDATPMTLGDEFGAYGFNVRRASDRLRAAEDPLLDVPLGGTAVGNGVNTKTRLRADGGRAAGGDHRTSIARGHRPRGPDAEPRRFRRALGYAARTRGGAEQDRERPAAAQFRPAHGPERDRAAGNAAGVVDHAGEGQSGDGRNAEHGLLSCDGAGQRDHDGE